MIRNRDILNCLPLLASALGDRYGVKVGIGGSKAYTNGKFIQLPALPVNCDKTMIALVKGYIDHESAHIRFTDFAALQGVAMLPLTRHLCNSIEDWRVEKHMSELYPGCKSNLAWLVRHIFLEEETERAGYKPAFSVLNYVLLTVRSWEVEELDKLRGTIRLDVKCSFPGLVEKLDIILERIRQYCPDTMTAVNYSLEITRLLKGYEAKHSKVMPENEDSTSGHSQNNANTYPNSVNQEVKRTEQAAEELQREDSVCEKNATSIAAENSGATGEKGETDFIVNDADNQRGLKSLLEAEEDELPDNLGEIIAGKLANYSPENDQTEITVASCHERVLGSLPMREKEDALKSSNALRQRLSGLLQAQELKRIASVKSGSLDMRKLASLATGNDRIFKKEGFVDGQNAAVHVLLDTSYSMNQEPIKLARQACYAVVKALDALKGINPVVTAFPTGCMGGVYPILKHGQKITDRFLVNANGGTPLASALWGVLQTIHPLPETRKIVLIITDGMPDNLQAAKDAIRVMQRIGIEVYGIGIHQGVIKDMLPGKSRVINEVSELASAMFGLLQKTLLKGGRHAGAR